MKVLKNQFVMIVVADRYARFYGRLKTDFYIFEKNDKLYITCTKTFNRKIKREDCSSEFNKTYLSTHT